MKCRTREDYKRKQRAKGFPRPMSAYLKTLLRVYIAEANAYEPPKPEKICSIPLSELRSCWGL